MNYLVFGGEGFIGKHLIDYLINTQKVEAGKVYSLDLERRSDHSNFIQTDVRKEIQLSIPDIQKSVIFNLAAIHTTPGHPDYDYFEANIRGAENISKFAIQNGISRIVFTSSIAPYGASESVKKEDTLPTPNTPYGISKLVAEHIFRTWQAQDFANRKLSIVRPGVVFGKGEGGNFTRLYNAQKKGTFFYPGRNDTLKACIYVKDVVRILHQTITSEISDNICLYNLTYQPAPSIQQICETIAEVNNVSKPTIIVPASLLKLAATLIYGLGAAFGKKFNGIHPDRVKKLMISTNINGQKLAESEFKLRYDLRSAILDWRNESGGQGLI